MRFTATATFEQEASLFSWLVALAVSRPIDDELAQRRGWSEVAERRRLLGRLADAQRTSVGGEGFEGRKGCTSAFNHRPRNRKNLFIGLCFQLYVYAKW